MTTHDEVAIVGVGTTEFGALYRDRTANRSAYTLGAQAFTAALADSGLDRTDIDGLICARLPNYTRMADLLGLRRPAYCLSIDGAGRMSAVAVQLAIGAIQTGMARAVALVYGNNGRSAGATYGGDAGGPTSGYDTAYGMTSPGAYVALMYQRYRELYSVPELALAPLAINNRSHAIRNENAVMRTPLTIEDYANGRFIAEPLRLFDYCLINDGGVAMILTSTDIARNLDRPMVTIRATAACGDLTNFYTSDDFFQESCRTVADRVFSAAGMTTKDVDCLQVYDNFTPTILFSLEGFGYCRPGTAWDWVRDGRIGLDGELPINTSGGHTSESYMQGWALHVEAVRQLRGEAGARQVPDCEVVQYICAAPITASHLLVRS
ncbi:MAG TPA: thiolase family protein [Natronosporangium sp.]